MESQNGLGIYIGKDTATVVFLDPRAKEGSGVDCFSVAVEQADEGQTHMQILAGRIARGCAERNWKCSKISVALDCALFMQHSVHSEFREPKQIAATVKFDTEETLATDISDVALAFEIASSDETGSDVTVFTAERPILSDLLTALQQHHLDPVTIEPDVNCLTRFIQKEIPSDPSQQEGALFGFLSRDSGYLLIPVASSEGARKTPICRTFLVGTAQDRGQLLSREVLITKALAENAESLPALRVFDYAGAVEPQQLREKLGMDVEMMDLSQVGGIRLNEMEFGANPIDIAIAYGAALTHSERGHKVDFRSDFSPFLGKRLKLQKALKFASVSVSLFLIAVGLYFQTQLFNVNKEQNKIRSKFARDYGDVTLERLSDHVSFRKAVSNLGSLLRRIKAEKMGLDPSQKSISSNLTLVLSAFNTCAADTDLQIDSVTVTDELVIVSADVASRQKRQTLFEAVRNGGLVIIQEAYDPTGGRESFQITLRPKNVNEKDS